MSINKFQEKVFRTGCGSAVLYVCAAVFFGGMFYLGCGLGGGPKGPGGEDNRAVALEVGETPIYLDQFNQNVEQMREQRIMQSNRSASPDALAPMDEAEIEGGMLNSYVTTYGAVYLAKKAGVKFTDQQITSVFEKDMESSIVQARAGLIQQHKIKPDATEKEVDAALKKAGQTTITERRKMFHDEITKALKDEKNRASLDEQAAKPLLLEVIQSSMKPTEAEVKATYDSSTFKRILFAEHPGSTPDSQIAKAQADLKAGLTFEQAMDRYSSEHPPKGKRVSDNTIDMNAAQLDSIPENRPLKSLKVGQVSDVIETPMGKAIYKLIGIKSMAPPDFPTNKAKYIHDFAMQHAQAEFDKEQKQFVESGPVTWKMPGLKALFDWYQARQDFMAPPAQQAAKMGAVVDEAKKAATTGNNDRPAVLAWYAGFDSMWTAPGANKTKLRGDRIEVLRALTSILPYFPAKMELVDLLVEAKQGDEAVDALKAAASSNFMYDLEGQQDYQEVQAKLLKLKAAGMIKPADEAEIAKTQAEWIKQNQIAAEEKAQQKKDEAAAKKEADANAAKQKADADKQKADAAKTDKASAGAKPPANGAAPKISVSVPPPGSSANLPKAGTSDRTNPPKKQ